jgi:hypothetical protein
MFAECPLLLHKILTADPLCGTLDGRSVELGRTKDLDAEKEQNRWHGENRKRLTHQTLQRMEQH